MVIFNQSFLLPKKTQWNWFLQNLAAERVFRAASGNPPPWNVTGQKCSRSASLPISQNCKFFLLIITPVVCISLSIVREEKSVSIGQPLIILGFLSSDLIKKFEIGQIYPNWQSSLLVHYWTRNFWKIPFVFPNVENGFFVPVFNKNSVFFSTSRHCTPECKE